MNKSNLKKTITIGLAAMALFASFGCGGNGKKSSNGSVVSAPQNEQQTNQKLSEVSEQQLQGDTYYKEGKYSEAIACYTRAINEGFSAYLERGNAFRAQGNTEAAVADYMKVINDGNKWIDSVSAKNPKYLQRTPKAPNDPRPRMSYAYIGIGYIRMEQNELNSAIENFTKALELEPRSEAYNGRGECYKRQGKSAQADADFAKVQNMKGK